MMLDETFEKPVRGLRRPSTMTSWTQYGRRLRAAVQDGDMMIEELNCLWGGRGKRCSKVRRVCNLYEAFRNEPESCSLKGGPLREW